MTTNKENTFNSNNYDMSSIIGQIAGKVFRTFDNTSRLHTVVNATTIAGAMVADIQDKDQGDVFLNIILDNIASTKVERSLFNEDSSTLEWTNVATDLPEEFVVEALLASGLVLESGSSSDALHALFDKYLPFYMTPHHKELELRNRTDRDFNGYSKLTQEALTIQEATTSHISTTVLNVAREVFKNKSANVVETLNVNRYVLEGCAKRVAEGNYPSRSEFKMDKRGRFYQAACHGSNGQAGDLQRALQDLSGVGTDYDIDKVVPVLIDEMADMVKGDVVELFQQVIANGSVQTIIDALNNPKTTPFKKVWSFVKGCFLLVELQKGNKPYIGMAFGKDAKCSGPQLAAVQAGDQQLMSACGFSQDQEQPDAYELAIIQLEKDFK